MFVTHNYQLMARIPAGLFHCPFPATYIGTDHGITLYRAAPAACDPGAPNAAHGIPDGPSVIQITYGYNVAEIGVPGQSRPPLTNAELARQECGPDPAPLPDGLTLFGRKAAGCVRRDGNRVRVTLVSLYGQERRPGAEPPDSEVSINLETDEGRLGRDVALLRRVAGSLRVCRGVDWPPVQGRPDCPPCPAW